MKKMFLTLTLIISCMEGIAQNATIKMPIGSSIPMAKEEFASVSTARARETMEQDNGSSKRGTRLS